MLFPFHYEAAHDVKELCALLGQRGPTAKVLAGGTDLLVGIRGGQTRCNYVIDIKRIPAFLAIEPTDDYLDIGTCVVAKELISNESIARLFPLLSNAASRLGSPQLRNRATIGGNICTSSPCADLSVALLALAAQVVIVSESSLRQVPLLDFFKGAKKNALQLGEVVTKIRILTAQACT